MMSERYVLRLIGHQGKVIGHRYALTFQAIGRMAAVVVPQAEMLRLLGETGGNTSAILTPMKEALEARGYDTLMVVPAQTQVVELVREGEASLDEPVHEEAARLQRESARLLVECAQVLMRVRGALEKCSDPEAPAIRSQVDGLAHRVAIAYVSQG